MVLRDSYFCEGVWKKGMVEWWYEGKVEYKIFICRNLFDLFCFFVEGEEYSLVLGFNCRVYSVGIWKVFF